MALDYGDGVSRTLDAAMRQYGLVVWQKNKPPLDSELNLMSQASWDALRMAVNTGAPSGFYMDPTRSLNDYLFNANWSNFFSFGNPRTPVGEGETAEAVAPVWASVNGWILPIAGSNVSAEGDLRNLIQLYPPPESDARIDFVFLEAWATLVKPNPSTTNKPSLSTIYKYGNALYGGTNLTDDLEDPTVGMETTARVQIQYRLRVYGQGAGLGAGVTLDTYPEGMDDPNVLAQGTSSIPVEGFPFTNMREDLGDPGMWRAGSGDPNNDLGTIDGYTYAIPICAVFRRSSEAYVAVEEAGAPSHNGGKNRTPSTTAPVGAAVLTTATLTSALDSATALLAPADIDITNLVGSGFDDDGHTLASTFMIIDNEIIGLSAVSTVDGTITIPTAGRGRYGTAAAGHLAGAAITFYNTRPDALYSDQVTEQDILDLRHAVNPGDWDFGRLLEHNIASLLKGDLRTTWKNAAEGDTQGVDVHEVTYLYGDGAVDEPSGTEPADGPDGIRMVWSDAATIQPDVTILLDNTAPTDNNQVGLTNANTFTSGAGYAWDVGAGFYPSGYLNLAAGETARFTNGSTILLFLGGADGTGGARATFRDGSTRAVRSVMPPEYWKSGYPIVDPTNGNQHPFSLRFLTERALEAVPTDLNTDYVDRHPGPMYPWREHNFELPFIVLGGILSSELKKTIATTGLSTLGSVHEIDLGINFDTADVYFSKDANGDFQNDPTLVSNPLLREQRTLYDMLTRGGEDRTGNSSEVYVVLYGDQDDRNNNGAFKVIGAGLTAGYTNNDATGATKIRVVALSPEFAGFDDATGNTVTVEFRSQYHNSDDTSSYNAKVADMAIVLTDIGGLSEHPWKRETLGYGEGDNYDVSMPFYPNPAGHASVPSKLLLSMTLMYHPGRGGTVRVPDEIVRFAMKGGLEEDEGAYLRQSPAAIDSTFSAVTGAPDNETFWDPAHVQLWNRLPALGWHAPLAPSYGGNVVGYTEIDREHELLIDRGSKTVVFRPFRDRQMTLQAMSWNADDVLTGTNCLLGGYEYLNTNDKDALRMWTGTAIDQGGTGKQMGFPVPREFMPRFGRQDIPYYVDTSAGAGPFLPGINHLFRDAANSASPVFQIIGGDPVAASEPGVNSMLFATGGVGALVPVYGKNDTMPAEINEKAFIWARRTGDIDSEDEFAPAIIASLKAVNSSDFGKGLTGIQLPPYYGIARLYGVYDARDYDTKGGRTFKANRYEIDDDPAPNLLRQDADQQTLFILEGGAKDATGEDGDHTYLVPYNALDITRALNYDAADAPADYNYVVECVIFGFAQGFIDENNLVLVRKFGGTGLSIDGGTDGNEDGDDAEIEGVHMVLPCPAGYHDQLYAAYNRTVYQGDPYMSRGGAKADSDYEHRYGQLSIAAQYALRMPIEQYDADGVFVPQIPNPKTFEVLASMDFYTTMGSGKIGGQLYPGTMLDVGYTQDTAKAAIRSMDATDVTWRIEPRAFTEGQKSNTSRAGLTLELLDNDGLNPADEENAVIRVGLLDDAVLDLYACKTEFQAALIASGVLATDIFTVDITRTVRELVTSGNLVTIAALAPGTSQTVTLPLTGVEVGDTVVVNFDAETFPFAISHAWVDVADIVTLMMVNTWPKQPFAIGTEANAVQDITLGASQAVAAHTTALYSTATFTEADAALTQHFVAQAKAGGDIDGIVWSAVATDADEITLYATNTTAAEITVGAGLELQVAMLEESVAADHTYDLSTTAAYVKVIKTDVSAGLIDRTAQNLATLINGHASLTRTLMATATGNVVSLAAVPVGIEGNGVGISVRHTGATSLIENIVHIVKPFSNEVLNPSTTNTVLYGGVDIPINAGDGTSQIRLTGMIERLPMGALLQDSDFLCENILGDDASAVKTSPTGPQPLQTVMPMTVDGGEFSRFFGNPGELVVLADGSISVTSFGAWRQVPEGGGGPTGSRRFRLYRGGGSAFLLSGDHPGGPLDWVSESFPKALQPVLKGGVLSCKALLVRNFREDKTPDAGAVKVSEGDEIQMVVLTKATFGDGTITDAGLTLGGSISPSGYGEGWAAADRYRLAGKPFFKGFNREVPDPTAVELVVYPDEQRP